jgi:hypothetical protein
MPEIGTSSSMSGDGKRSDGLRPQATAPILDSTIASFRCAAQLVAMGGQTRTSSFGAARPLPPAADMPAGGSPLVKLRICFSTPSATAQPHFDN